MTKEGKEMKLYEVLLRKLGLRQPDSVKEKTAEEKIYNPIGCKLGGVVKIDSIDFRDHRFTVKEIREYSVGIGGDQHQMVDYVLLSRPIGKPDFSVRLRVVPDSDSQSRITHRALVLFLYDDIEYNEGLHDVVRDDTKKFIIDDDKDDEDSSNDSHEEFWRVNDVGTSYLANVKTLAPHLLEGEIELNDIRLRNSLSQVEFWDYSRLTDIDGIGTEEFVFVEMNKKNGWFQVWRGAEVIPERIEVF